MDEEIMTAAQEPTTAEVVDIQFHPGQKVYYFDPAGFDLKAGDHVIIETARGPEYGTCVGGNHTVRSSEVVAPLRSVLRLATADDERIVAENQEKEKRAFQVCLQKIGEHGLDMQLVSVECAFDGSKILFFFTADERVDFRELVKNLAFVFHTRIELRQIGVRDKAKMVGGLGICGRPFCCATFLEDFQPVSIKMAKTQSLSLNPTKISGTCGRLMCCLKYEQEAYEDLLRRTPKEESLVDTPDGRGTVIEVGLLRQRVKVRMEADPDTISVYAVDDIAVLRNGKGKKTDPPIPADEAPISGKKAPTPQKEREEAGSFLDPIKFRYRDEAVVEEPTSQEESEEPKPQRNRRRNYPRQKPTPKPEAKPTEKAETGEEAAEKGEEKPDRPHRRRSYYHRRKPKAPQG